MIIYHYDYGEPCWFKDAMLHQQLCGVTTLKKPRWAKLQVGIDGHAIRAQAGSEF